MRDTRTVRRLVGAAALAAGAVLAGVGGTLATIGTAGAAGRTAAIAGTAIATPATVGRHGTAPAHASWRTAKPHVGGTTTLWVTATNGHDTPAGVANNCTVQATPCKTLGHALAEVPAVTATTATIILLPGTYKEATNPSGTPNVVPDTVHDLTIFSTTGPTSTIITAAGFTTGITVNSSRVGVEGLTITHARREGILAAPSTGATHSVHLTYVGVFSDEILANDTCATTAAVSAATASACATATPLSDYGEAVHLQSVALATIKTNLVKGNDGGILVTDENGPSFTITIGYNTSLTNIGDCGITLAGHNPTAVYTTGATTGKPDQTSAGVYHVFVYRNAVDNNGAAGILDAGGPPGTGVYDNAFIRNVAAGNGLAGLTIHSHAPLQDMNTNVVEYNSFVHNALRGGPDGGPGDVEGPPDAADMVQSAGIQVLAAIVPVKGTTIEDNSVSTDFYGIWMSPGVAPASTIAANSLTVTSGGTPIFSEPAPDTGYWMAGADGGAFAFTLGFYGSAPGQTGASSITGIAATPDGGGYWMVGRNGAVHPFGDALSHGTLPADGVSVSDIVGIATTPTGGGYWLVGKDGGIFAFGNAVFHGSMAGKPLNAPVVGIAAAPTGKGYYEVAADGGIFAFTATFHGSMGGKKLNAPMVGIAATPGGKGYWEVASDGGVFAFTAKFAGSMGGKKLNAPVVGIAATPAGNGYWEVASDGGVFNFGTAKFFGSMGGKPLQAPVIGLTTNPA